MQIPRMKKSTRDANDFPDYLDSLLHSWLKTLMILGFTLMPIFFILDIFIIPSEVKELLPKFLVYRLVSTFISVMQLFIISRTRSSKYSFVHGYIFNFYVCGTFVLMTVDLGGFDSSYYASLNLVLIAVNLLLPWKAFHSAVNGLSTLILYVGMNVVYGMDFHIYNLINNLYFMISTVIISVTINHVRYLLIQKEFESRKDLQVARDALWREMEMGSKVQSLLLPSLNYSLSHLDISGKSISSKELGGDYFGIYQRKDILHFTIGDVAGKGVASCLIMATVKALTEQALSDEGKSGELVSKVNSMISSTISFNRKSRLKFFVTSLFASIKVKENGIYLNYTNAGHLEPLILRKNGQFQEQKNLVFPPLGVDAQIQYESNEILLESGDFLLFYTDGIIEQTSDDGTFYGIERLKYYVMKNYSYSTDDFIEKLFEDIHDFRGTVLQEDDITLITVKVKNLPD